MNISLITVGRMGSCPEANLVAKYRQRFDNISNSMGLKSIKITEIDTRKYKTLNQQARKIREKFDSNSSVFLFNERGKTLSSIGFTRFLLKQRNEGTKNQIFVIGGAHGLCPSLNKDADGSLSLGKMVWPHFLARVLVLEQLYRSACLTKGIPYHKA